MTSMAVFYYLAVGYLNVFEDLYFFVDNGEDLKPGWEAYGQEQAAWMHRHRQGLFIEDMGYQAFLFIALNIKKVPNLDSIIFRAGGKKLFGHSSGQWVNFLIMESRWEKLIQRTNICINPKSVQIVVVKGTDLISCCNCKVAFVRWTVDSYYFVLVLIAV